jgi:hypothetical protein
MGISGKNKLHHNILSLTVRLVATQNFATDKCHTSEKKNYFVTDNLLK